MKFDKRISRLLAKFILASTAISCFGCCASAMEDKKVNEENATNQQIIASAMEELKHACYMVVQGDKFRGLIKDYITEEYNNERNNPTQFSYFLQPGRLLALKMLEDKEEFSKLLPQFAKFYVTEIMEQ